VLWPLCVCFTGAPAEDLVLASVVLRAAGQDDSGSAG